MAIPTQFIQIDEEGYVVSREAKIKDAVLGEELLENLKLHQSGTLLSTYGGTPVIVEAFDEPLIAQQILLENGQWTILCHYGVEFNFELSTLSLDEWDRFHGYTVKDKVPFVMSRKAQAGFFNMLEEFDDEAITVDGKTYEIPTYWPDKIEIEKEDFWTKSYQGNNNPGWNLGEPAEALKDMIPRLKLSRSRILVLGCGEGHDAALFAQSGHVVTAVDISPLALERAKKLYGHITDLHFVEADLFNLPRTFEKSFDIIFEHTCYCAINPSLRQDLVKIWNKMLVDGGFLMGVFFTFEKRQGPPFGGSEWELRQRLKNNYHPIFWGRWGSSIPNRQGKELFIYSKKT